MFCVPAKRWSFTPSRPARSSSARTSSNRPAAEVSTAAAPIHRRDDCVRATSDESTGCDGISISRSMACKTCCGNSDGKRSRGSSFKRAEICLNSENSRRASAEVASRCSAEARSAGVISPSWKADSRSSVGRGMSVDRGRFWAGSRSVPTGRSDRALPRKVPTAASVAKIPRYFNPEVPKVRRRRLALRHFRPVCYKPAGKVCLTPDVVATFVVAAFAVAAFARMREGRRLKAPRSGERGDVVNPQ